MVMVLSNREFSLLWLLSLGVILRSASIENSVIICVLVLDSTYKLCVTSSLTSFIRSLIDDFSSFFISDSTMSPISSLKIDFISFRISSRSVRLDEAVCRLSGEIIFSLI